MSTQLIALLMFLLLTYLLFRRRTSAAPWRDPGDLHIQIMRPAYLKNDSPKEKARSAAAGSGINRSLSWKIAPGVALILLTGMSAVAQTPAGSQVQLPVTGNNSKADREDKEYKKEGGAANDRAKDGKDGSATLEEIRQMRQLIERLEARVNQLEAEKSAAAVKPALSALKTQDATVAAPSATPTAEQTSVQSEGGVRASNFFRDTTISGTVDGYYGYNFNRPVGRISLLRAYDVSSNSFSLNQAVVSVERAPDVDASRRFGMRLDLMYGQATETVQGNAANEPRPQVYRPLWWWFGKEGSW